MRGARAIRGKDTLGFSEGAARAGRDIEWKGPKTAGGGPASRGLKKGMGSSGNRPDSAQTRFSQGQFHLGLAIRRQRGDGQPHRGTTAAQLGQGPFGGGRAGFAEQLLVQRKQLHVQGSGFSRAAFQGHHAELVHGARCHVGRHAHIALAAQQHQGHGGGVITRVDGKALGCLLDQPGRAFDAAAGFFQADHPGQLGQAQGGLDRHVCHGPAWHVVEHHRQVHRLEDGLEVLVDAFLRGLVVVRHHRQAAVRADLLRKAGELDGLAGGVAAGARHHGHPPANVVYRDADDLAVLLDRHRGRFAGGADHPDAVGAFGNVPVDQGAQAVVVDLAVVEHRRDERHDAANNGFHAGSLGISGF